MRRESRVANSYLWECFMLGGGTYPAAVRRWIFWQKINVVSPSRRPWTIQIWRQARSLQACFTPLRLVRIAFTACKTTPVQGTASGGWHEMEGLKVRVQKIREKNADSAEAGA